MGAATDSQGLKMLLPGLVTTKSVLNQKLNQNYCQVAADMHVFPC